MNHINSIISRYIFTICPFRVTIYNIDYSEITLTNILKFNIAVTYSVVIYILKFITAAIMYFYLVGLC